MKAGRLRQAELGYLGRAAAHLHDHPPLPVPFRRTVAFFCVPTSDVVVVPVGMSSFGVCITMCLKGLASTESRNKSSQLTQPYWVRPPPYLINIWELPHLFWTSDPSISLVRRLDLHPEFAQAPDRETRGRRLTASVCNCTGCIAVVVELHTQCTGILYAQAPCPFMKFY